MFSTLRFFLFYPKIAPDMYLTHWLLYFKTSRVWFQKKKLYSIGNNSEIRPFVSLNGTNSISIGDNVIVPPGTILSAMPNDIKNGIFIENDVLLGPNVSIYSATHKYKDITIPIKKQGYTAKKVLIKEGSWLGVNSVIMPGVTIGKNAVVAAGSIVTKDVPDNCIVAGVPAKIIKKLGENDDKEK
ncbi:acyltransferase [Sulfurimonas sp. SAG-AH-194-I05]|nr:acyltransferase [Sulfurimonas sp. SAG-AH-194-I05]MDF1874438.1 acyltransferase [Sulfurimonas sp. SAG-AH-194-I05]